MECLEIDILSFWEYHCAINIDLEKNKAYLDGLLIRGAFDFFGCSYSYSNCR